MTSERQAYIYIQLPGTLNTVPAADSGTGIWMRCLQAEQRAVRPASSAGTRNLFPQAPHCTEIDINDPYTTIWYHTPH